jgi:hypothetical protein
MQQHSDRASCCALCGMAMPTFAAAIPVGLDFLNDVLLAGVHGHAVYVAQLVAASLLAVLAGRPCGERLCWLPLLQGL